MIDNFDNGVDHEESAFEYACYVAADQDGYTTEQADNCDECSLHCTNCPFVQCNNK